MDTQNLKDKFASLGARLNIRETQHTRWTRDSGREYTLNVISDRREEYFDLRVFHDSRSDLDISVPCLDKKLRHLILYVRTAEKSSQFLCGHDERHWFAATLPRNATSIRHAFQMLKPDPVQLAQSMKKVPSKLLNKRRNAGFQRQGEWFFVPATDIDVIDTKKLIIYENEPLVRGRSKPHMADELCRIGGETVYVNRDYPNGLTADEHARYCMEHPGTRAHEFRVMRRGATVYVKGAVKHLDHKTVHLDGWHRVFVNNEGSASELAFLD